MSEPTTMKVNDVEYVRKDSMQGCTVPDDAVPFAVGQKYFIRGVTTYVTGRVVRVTGGFIVLEDAAWIADTGLFAAALKSGEFSEVEPFPHVCIVSLAAVMDACPWPHALPTVQS